MAEPSSPPVLPSLAQFKLQRGPAAGRRRRRWPWGVGGLVVVALAVLLLAPRHPEVQLSTVQTAYGSQQYGQLAASGYVVAQRRAAVASKASGRLVELTVREGTVLKTGELIARVDASDVQAALALSQAGVGQAQAVLVQAQAGLTQAEVQQRNADEDLRRTQGLVAQGFVSPQALDAARTRARSADAATAGARAALGTAQAAITQAQAQVKVQQVNRDSTEIRAPFDGVVLVKNANVGDLITPFSNASGTSAAVVTMADMSTLEVEADVSESNVAKVQRDQPVEITLDAIPGVRFRGSVSRIVPTVDRAKATVMTKVRFAQLDPRILPEMSAKVNFLSQAVTDADQQPVLAVNPQTLVDRDGTKMLWRIAPGDQLQAVEVSVGRTLGDVVEVKGGGLKAGDRLVLSPAPDLKAGQTVRIAALAK
jgi:RND family efflux transporter MFP subunit